ncbi:MAG: prephenate dehydrogenase [Runella slithyformis]|nr:MAG: prephenate dehydrogenase [Runella slithyformis]TAG23050.1 MAG: prephenate dehydrogenase [Cytophagales bacterium]TAG42831.1 MAG: prephenate dehydrogenase [Cytophagia bacterium]TAF02109.1 MAG: prephenate dehydrogenase [Runella slithyformis]TAF25040.1 MAG: prephenate dehydrogenase [Runella slithyformis]
MVTSIIGIGLLGGSYALNLRDKYPKMHFIGVDSSEVHGRLAMAKGIVDEVLTLEEAVLKSDLVVLAVPVNYVMELLPQVLNLLPPKGTVLDLGSTKQLISQTADAHPRRSRFVAAHPMAGTENSGPSAAFRELLPDKNVIICDRDKSDPDSLALVEALFREIGMKLHYMTPEEHDLHLAYVSHLSHVSAFALGYTVLEKEKDEQNIFDMASTGFSSTVRLAKSSPAMWAPIFDQNRENLSQALADYIDFLQQYKQFIDNRDLSASFDFMKRANEIRRILSGIDRK